MTGDRRVGGPHAGVLVPLHSFGEDVAVVFWEHGGDPVGDCFSGALGDPALSAGVAVHETLHRVGVIGQVRRRDCEAAVAHVAALVAQGRRQVAGAFGDQLHREGVGNLQVVGVAVAEPAQHLFGGQAAHQVDAGRVDAVPAHRGLQRGVGNRRETDGNERRAGEVGPAPAVGGPL